MYLPLIYSVFIYSIWTHRPVPLTHFSVSHLVAGDWSADGTGQKQMLVLQGQAILLVQSQKSHPAWFWGKYISLFPSFLSCLELVLSSWLTLGSPADIYTPGRAQSSCSPAEGQALLLPASLVLALGGCSLPPSLCDFCLPTLRVFFPSEARDFLSPSLIAVLLPSCVLPSPPLLSSPLLAPLFPLPCFLPHFSIIFC